MYVDEAERDAAVAFLKEPGVIPSRVTRAGDDPRIVLVDIGDAPLLGPFLEDSIRAALSTNQGFARRHRAPLSLFDVDVTFDDAVPVAGILFHVSRCGSTIPVRALQADPTTNVVAEADPIDVAAVRIPASHDARVRRIRRAVAMFARKRTAETKRLVLKLDAWHLVHHRAFREAFPDVPTVVVVRDPIEVLASHMRRRGSHTIPGLFPASFFDIGAGEFQPHELDRYAALVLRSLYRHAADAVKTGTTLVRYPDLPAAAFETILPAFGVTPDERMRASTAWLSERHAKSPEHTFDAAAERAETIVGDQHRAWIDELVRPAYETLGARGTI